MSMLLIHHWDTDGICSASMVIEEIGEEIDNMVPFIGNYFLTEEEKEMCSGYDKIYIVDLALPEEDITSLLKHAGVTIFDHHLYKPIEGVELINPLMRGEEQYRYPSTTWVLKEHFGRKVDLLAVLGVVGDNEERIMENRIFRKVIERFCKREKIRFEDLLRAVHLIDSNYKLNMKKEVEEIPWLLRDMDIKDILEHPVWNRNNEILEKEIQEIVSNEDAWIKKGKTLIIEINTTHNIISSIARKIAWSTGMDTVVMNRGLNRHVQIYVRSKNNLTRLIDLLKEKNLKAGGKRDVVGILAERERAEEILEFVVNFLEKNDER